MDREKTQTGLDTFVVLVAVLISLATILLSQGYRDVATNPAEDAGQVARLTLAIAGQPTQRTNQVHLSGRDSEALQLAGWLDEVRGRLAEAVPDARLSLFSDHPNFAQMSEETDEFRLRALKAIRSGEVASVGESIIIDGVPSIRLAVPLRAFSECDGCMDQGVVSFSHGDIIGLREVQVPIGDEDRTARNQLMYSGLLLGVTLFCVVLIIYPVLRRRDVEKRELNKRARSLEMAAFTDSLTGLNNRRFFEKSLTGYLEEFNRSGNSLGLLVIDIDHFKKVNDTFGHDAGDMVLQKIAGRLQQVSREYDVLARVGGEEFAIIAPYSTEDDIEQIADRYRRSVEEMSISIGSAIIRPTISVGVATNADGQRFVHDLLKTADARLYEAKHGGRNRIAA